MRVRPEGPNHKDDAPYFLPGVKQNGVVDAVLLFLDFDLARAACLDAGSGKQN
jgi:hypothetical protein